MKHTYFLSICAVIFGVQPFPPPAFAEGQSETTQTIENCLNMGSGVPSPLAYDACLSAFDAAINEAQKPEHSQNQRSVLWMQASKAASLAMLKKLTIDGKVSLVSCRIALNGLKADNQISADYKEAFPDLQSRSTLKPIYDHCYKNGFYKKPD